MFFKDGRVQINFNFSVLHICVQQLSLFLSCFAIKKKITLENLEHYIYFV